MKIKYNSMSNSFNEKIYNKWRNAVVKTQSFRLKLFRTLKIYPSHRVDTFIVGTQKGGTSSLFNFLKNSTEIITGKRKEIGYFSRELLFKKDVNWYNDQFPYGLQKNIRQLDATPEYLYFPSVPQRIYDYNPKARIIILLREPVSRAYSHYRMFAKFHTLSEREKHQKYKHYFALNPKIAEPLWELINKDDFPEFNTIIKREIYLNSIENEPLEPSFIRRGLYYHQVKRYLDLFSENQVMIIETDELKKNKRDILIKTCDFLNISTDFLEMNDFEDSHVGDYKKSSIKEEDSDLLRSFYKNSNEELFNLINKRFNW